MIGVKSRRIDATAECNSIHGVDLRLRFWKLRIHFLLYSWVEWTFDSWPTGSPWKLDIGPMSIYWDWD